MAWELRSGRRYMYRSVRHGHRVRKVYLGAGEAAQRAAEKDAAMRAKRAADQVELAAFQAELASVDHLTAEIQQGVDLLAEAALFAHGFHQHHGEWRRRRDVDLSSG